MDAKNIACSACYGSGYGVDGKPCPCGCRPRPAPAIAPQVAAGSAHDVCRDSERFYRQNCLAAIERAEKAEAELAEALAKVYPNAINPSDTPC